MLILYAAVPAAAQETGPSVFERAPEAERPLRERGAAVVEELRQYATAIREFEQGNGDRELRSRLEEVLARVHEVLEDAMLGDSGDARHVFQIESARDEITHRLKGLDPCESRLRPALTHLDVVPIERSFVELCEVAEMRCLYAPHAVDARQALAGLVPDLAELDRAVELYGAAKVTEKLRALLRLPAERLEHCLPGAGTELADGLKRLRAEGLGSATTAAPAHPTRRPAPDRPPSPPPETPSPAIAGAGKDSGQEQRPSRSDAGFPRRGTNGGFLTLNVWQSAWGDFSEFEEIIPYLRRNRITEVNLNPGFEMFDDFHDEAYQRLQPLVETLRRAGVERIHFLYAELNYPVERYAAFLNKFPSLGIHRIVDDSEFTDHFVDRFRRNHAAVSKQGLGYGAFVTLEGFGNSGVSDTTRYWALRRLDEPILMSYFGCSVEEQIELLDPYLRYADDQRPGVRNVKVALLLGGKRVGREVSCEQQLDARGFQDFVAELDRRLRSYRSYAGIVLETNYRLPRYDVSPSAVR
ncbi:MAG: hypothetical protein GY856_45535 [bacterium]|nr:hypothetical protein [bacterium]